MPPSHTRPWAMMEVYLLGVIVAYVKLQEAEFAAAEVPLGERSYPGLGGAGANRSPAGNCWRATARQPRPAAGR